MNLSPFTPRALLPLLAGAAVGLFLIGCESSDGGTKNLSHIELGDDTGFNPDSEDELAIRVDVLPSQLLDGQGMFRALPLSTASHLLDGDLDVGTLRLSRPAYLEGEVLAELLTPTAQTNGLPHRITPLQGEISLRKPHTVQKYRTRIDTDGFFGTEIVPQDGYELVILPDDPQVPMYLDVVRVPGTPPWQSLHVDYGVAIWGWVTDASGAPMVGAAVIARHELADSAPTYTNSEGFYSLRVPLGHTFQILSNGRAHGRDPTLISEPFEVEEDGLQLDLQYATLQPRVLGGTIVDPNGTRLDGAKIHLVSDTLAAYPEGGAVHTVEAVTANGTFDVRLLEGVYQMTVLPPSELEPGLTPTRQTIEITADTADFGTLQLAPLQLVSGQVVDPSQQPVVEARITCRDTLGDQAWSTYAGPNGEYALNLPQSPFHCTLTPPGSERARLATTRLAFSGDPLQMDPILRFDEGVQVHGQVVHAADGPELAAVIEVRDLDGRLLGSTLTDADGAFSLRVSTARH